MEFEPDDEFPVAHIFWHGMPVGRAEVSFEGDTAELIDIQIQARLPHWNPIRRAFGCKANYRGRGLGSILLEHVCDRLAVRGVRQIVGELMGDPQRLARWYRSHGFLVDEETSAIKKQLTIARSDMRPAIVLDKCFLQGAKGSRIRELATTHRLIMSDALFYELLSSSEPRRSKCFAKFPRAENPVELVSHIGKLMRYEIETHNRAGKPSDHREELRFQFNPQLMNADYVLPDQARAVVDEKTIELCSDVAAFLERVSVIQSLFPDLLRGSASQQAKALVEAERAIAEPGALLPFYSSLVPPLGEKPLPVSNLVSEDWAVYRWLQVQLLFALDVYVRYRGEVPAELSPNIYEKMEHDVLDAQVLMLGCLEGALATHEKKLIRWFRLLCPNGVLHE